MTDPLGSGDGATTAGPPGSIGVAMLGVAHTPHAMSYARAVREVEGAHLAGVYDGDAGLGTALADRFDTRFHDDVDTLLDAGASCGGRVQRDRSSPSSSRRPPGAAWPCCARSRSPPRSRTPKR